MINNFKENFKRTGKNVKGQILHTDFILSNCPFTPKGGRGISKYRLTDRFLILSTDHPKITINGFKEDYIIALHVWGKDKSKDNILIDKEFPNDEIAKKFMSFIKNIRLKNAS